PRPLRSPSWYCGIPSRLPRADAQVSKHWAALLDMGGRERGKEPAAPGAGSAFLSHRTIGRRPSVPAHHDDSRSCSIDGKPGAFSSLDAEGNGTEIRPYQSRHRLESRHHARDGHDGEAG